MLRFAQFLCVVFLLAGLSLRAQDTVPREQPDYPFMPSDILGLAQTMHLHLDEAFQRGMADGWFEKYTQAYLGDLSKPQRQIRDLFYHFGDSKADAYNWLTAFDQYCHVTMTSNSDCLFPDHFNDMHGGILFVSDVIQGSNPFMIVIMGNTAPGKTVIFRLFSNRLELVYALPATDDPCGIKPYGLFKTFGVIFDKKNEWLLYEKERFLDNYPLNIFRLNLTSNSCLITHEKSVYD